jgi:hypothetical protein
MVTFGILTDARLSQGCYAAAGIETSTKLAGKMANRTGFRAYRIDIPPHEFSNISGAFWVSAEGIVLPPPEKQLA